MFTHFVILYAMSVSELLNFTHIHIPYTQSQSHGVVREFREQIIHKYSIHEAKDFLCDKFIGTLLFV